MAKETVVDLARERRRRRALDGVRMTEDELLEAFRAGKSILHKIYFGFLIASYIDDETGMVRIEADDQGHELYGPAEAEYARRVVEVWTARLAEYDARVAD